MKKLLILLCLCIISTTIIFAQIDTTKKPKSTHHQMYTCTMHPEFSSAVAGKCPKCDRPLTLSKKEKMKMDVMKLYACPMHPDQTSTKSGKCPICGKKMVAKKRESNT